MPVAGHAFAGTIVSVLTEPRTESGRERLRYPALFGWAGLNIVLAYAPDVVEQILTIGGWRQARSITHSFLFSGLFAGLIAVGLNRFLKFPAKRALAFSFVGVFGHVLLDILHHTDQTPFWPFRDEPFNFGFQIPAHTVWQELWVYGPLFLLMMLYGEWRNASRSSGLKWPARVLRCVPAIALLATSFFISLGAFSIRTRHEADLVAARNLVHERQFEAASLLIEKASRWPFPVPLAAAESLRGEIYEAQGEWSRAEAAYITAYSHDPDYFWAVANAAQFYASRRWPLEERRRRTAPYILKLRSQFDEVPERSIVLGRLERRLEVPPGSLSAN